MAVDNEFVETSLTFGRRQDIVASLIDAVHEASSDVETDPVLLETFRQAAAFARNIPSGTPLPDVMVHPDGEVAFEWYRAKDRVLTVSVGPSTVITYALLLVASTVYGREPFTGVFPGQIAYLLARLYPTPTRYIARYR
jgi:hypothetical protein